MIENAGALKAVITANVTLTRAGLPTYSEVILLLAQAMNEEVRIRTATPLEPTPRGMTGLPEWFDQASRACQQFNVATNPAATTAALPN